MTTTEFAPVAATAAATAADFADWRKRAKGLTESELRWVIQDCREAAEAMKGWNPVKEGFYEDQAFTYADELRARQMGGR